MTAKRILFVQNDRLLQQLYREKLEESGFAIDVRDNPKDVIARPTGSQPDVILLDPVHETGTAIDFIKSLRADAATATVPILILPSALHELAHAALQAGATRVIEQDASPITAILNAIRLSLGQRELGKAGATALFKPEEFWIQSIFSASAQSINQMRQCLPGVAASPVDPAALQSLWYHVHVFAERAVFLPTTPLAQFLGALDLMLSDLVESPDQLNPSTLRTIGQSIDFLTTIANPKSIGQIADTAGAKIMVVDDEPNALQFISAALHLADLKCDSAVTPASCLEQLGRGRWDLIFLDVNLPEVDGFQLCTKIRSIETLKTTPIVFITGMTTFKNKATASLSGGNDFIGKPFNLCELGVKALTWLYRGQLQAA
jgi:DNA-binding response OmpR family regulator